MRDPNRNILRVTLLAASTLVIFGGAIMAPTLPAIGAQFQDLPNVEFWVRFVLTLPSLMIAVNAPLAGYIVDTFGRKRLLVGSTILAGLAGFSGYLAPTFFSILVGRAILGVAVAGLMTSTTTLIADYYYGQERSRFMGLQSGVMGLAGTLLLPITGLLADSSWRLPFLVHLLAFAVLPFIVLVIYEPRSQERCTDKPPASGEPGTCAGQAHQEAQPAAPLGASSFTPLRLIGFIYAVILLIEIVFFIIPIQLPFYLADVLEASAAQSGLAISVMSLSFAVSSMFFGRLAARFDHISVLMISFAITGSGYALITLSGGNVILYVGLALAGIGLGQLVPNLYVWLANETPFQLRGRVLGGFTTALFLGQFLSPLVSRPVVSVFAAANTFLIAGLLLLALVPLLFIGRGRLRALTAQPA